MFALLLSLFISFSAQAELPNEGVYEGRIDLNNGLKLNLSFQLAYSNEEVPGAPDDLLPHKKKITGAFILQNEAGPYTLSLINFDIETGLLDLIYSRTQGTPTLRFKAQLGPHSSIHGHLVSELRGPLGNFQVILNPQLSSLKIEPRYIGNYLGDWTFQDTRQKVPAKIILSPSTNVQINPSSLELEYTPGKAGSLFIEESLPFAFSEITMDYFTGTIKLNHANPMAGGGRLTLDARIDDEMLVGDATSSFRGRTARFEGRRAP